MLRANPFASNQPFGNEPMSTPKKEQVNNSTQQYVVDKLKVVAQESRAQESTMPTPDPTLKETQPQREQSPSKEVKGFNEGPKESPVRDHPSFEVKQEPDSKMEEEESYSASESDSY
jgi:hypothetical protein